MTKRKPVFGSKFLASFNDIAAVLKNNLQKVFFSFGERQVTVLLELGVRKFIASSADVEPSPTPCLAPAG